MEGKDKNIKTGLSGFLRYMRKKIPYRDRNSFERELQKDPFAEEAAEGFDGLSADEVKDDMITLRKRLKARSAGKNRLIFYRIAASVTVLMVISSIVIVIQRNKTEKFISENVRNEIQFEISEAPVFSEPGQKHQDIAVKDLKGNGQKLNEAEKISAPEKKEAEMPVIPADQARAMAKSVSKTDEAISTVRLKGKVISSEDNLPVPGANIILKGTSLGTLTDSGGNFSISVPKSGNPTLVVYFVGMESKEFSATSDSIVRVSLIPTSVALNEVVVVGLGEKRVSDREMAGAIRTENKKEPSVYTAPQPVEGKDKFEKYIEENIQRPADAGPGQKEVVVLGFTVKRTGAIDKIRIIRSPGKSFSDEAVRLIIEGPAWKPAEENNTKIDEEVRIRIVFK